MKKTKMSLVFNIFIIISSLVGMYLTIFNNSFMSTRMFLYYTIQSNILILIISSIFVIYDILLLTRKQKKIPNYIFLIKYIFTVGITITFLIFAFTLMPQMIMMGTGSYLLSVGNITLHFLSPILAIITLICFDNNLKLKKSTAFYGLIDPLYYFVLIMILSFIPGDGYFKSMSGEFTKFPYFFFDYPTNGWFTVTNDIFKLGSFYWIIIIFLLTFIISKLLCYLIKRKMSKESKQM